MSARDTLRALLAQGWVLAAGLAVLFFAGVAEVYWATALYGPGVTSDSVHYMAAAHSLLESGSFRRAAGLGVYQAWPPLYPTVLAVSSWIFGDVLQAARWVNALAFGGTASLIAWALHRSTRSAILALMGGILTLACWPLLVAAVHVWSEPLFILLSLASMLALGDYIFEDRRRAFLCAVVLAALACLQRYLGVAVIAAGGLGLLIFDRRAGLAERARKAAAYGALAITPLLIWLARNHVLTDTLTGPRAPSDTSLWKNIERFSSSLVESFLPYSSGGPSWIWLVIALGGISLAGARTAAARARSPIPRSVPGRHERILLVGLLGLTYSVALVAAATTAGFDRLNHRLVSPAIPPAIILALLSVYALSKASREGLARTCITVSVLALTALFVADTAALLTAVRGWRQSGAGGCNSTARRQSPAMQWVMADGSNRVIVSDEALAMGFLTGRETLVPPRNGSEDAISWLSAHAGSLWIWFPDGKKSKRYMSPKDARDLGIEVVSVAELEDARVFRIADGASGAVTP